MDYDAWNATLTEHFFVETSTPGPVYLSVDDALLADLMSAKLGQPISRSTAITDFQNAIRRRVYGRAPFSDIRERTYRWKRDGAWGNPPFIALLAVTVLAAARMDRSKEAVKGTFSYYGPLRQLLGLTDGAGMPDGYDETIPSLWNTLEWWLVEKNSGRLGLPSAVSHPTQVNIGRSLSQAVLLGADRAQIRQFLASLQTPSKAMSESELLKRFQEWVRVHRINARIERAISDRSLRPVLATVLSNEFRHYQATSETSHARPSIPLSLATENGGWPYELIAHVPPNIRIDELRLSTGTVPVPPRTAWIPIPSPTVEPAPGQSLRIEASSVDLTLNARDCYVFQPNDLVGRWTSVLSAEVGISHRVLVRDIYSERARELMLACGSPHPKRTRRVKVPDGWTLFTGYVPERSPQIDTPLRALIPEQQKRKNLWLSGGLQIDPRTHSYITGYEPDLFISSDVAAEGRMCILSNGKEISIDLEPEQELTIVHLADHGLDPGLHRVRAGIHTLTFTSVDRYRETPSPPHLLLPVTRGRVSLLPITSDELSLGSPNTTVGTSAYLAGASFELREPGDRNDLGEPNLPAESS